MRVRWIRPSARSQASALRFEGKIETSLVLEHRCDLGHGDCADLPSTSQPARDAWDIFSEDAGIIRSAAADLARDWQVHRNFLSGIESGFLACGPPLRVIT